jgi:hypothetical protein
MVIFHKNIHSCRKVTNVETIDDLKANIKNFLEDFEIFEGQKVPEDLTGQKIFLLKWDQSKTVASQVACGRKYEKLRRTGHDKILSKIFKNQYPFVKMAQCQGSYMCVNKDCPFTARFNVMNQVVIYHILRRIFQFKHFSNLSQL